METLKRKKRQTSQAGSLPKPPLETRGFFVIKHTKGGRKTNKIVITKNKNKKKRTQKNQNPPSYNWGDFFTKGKKHEVQ